MEGYESMVIHTDSMYILKSASLWLEGWKRRGWVTAQKKTNGEVKNLDMWKEYDELKNAFHIEYVHVKGHSGDEYNEKCDSMVHKAMYR
jgi:ribonuclease HI